MPAIAVSKPDVPPSEMHRAREKVRAVLGAPSGRPGPCSYSDLLDLGLRDGLYRPSRELDQVLTSLVARLQGPPVGSDSYARVDHLAAQLIAEHDVYAARARTVRRISARAETSLELTYGPRMAREDIGPGGSLVERALRALRPFPYREHYRDLSASEAILAPEVRHWLVAGAGPAPLSGLWLHWLTGARVTLVDLDPEAVAIASALVRRLETQGLVSQGFIVAQVSDVAELLLPDDVDGVLVAALVPQQAKVALARRVAESERERRVLIRSARGLTAQLAYAPAPRPALEAAGLTFVGEVVPQTHITSQPSLPHLLHEGTRTLLGVSSPLLLNSTELYRS
ncbi:MAG: nicotianamine synthase family protein [Myxococcota bacterium]